MLPSQLGQLAKGHEFVDLCPVGCVCNTTRSQTIPQAQCQIIFSGDGEQAVIILIKRIFSVVMNHPGRKKGSAPAHNIRNPALAFEYLQCRSRQPAVNRDKVDSFFGLSFNNIKYLVDRQVNYPALFIYGLHNSLVYRDRTYGNG